MRVEIFRLFPSPWLFNELPHTSWCRHPFCMVCGEGFQLSPRCGFSLLCDVSSVRWEGLLGGQLAAGAAVLWRSPRVWCLRLAVTCYLPCGCRPAHLHLASAGSLGLLTAWWPRGVRLLSRWLGALMCSVPGERGLAPFRTWSRKPPVMFSLSSFSVTSPPSFFLLLMFWSH